MFPFRRRSLPRRLQFSLGSILLLFVAVAIPLRIVSVRAQRQKSAVKAILDAGGKIAYRFEVDASGAKIDSPQLPGPAWLRNWLGIDYMARVVSIEVIGGTIGDELAVHLRALPDVERLSFAGSDLSDDRLGFLEDMTALRRLNLPNTRVSGAGLAPLRGHGSLTWLNLYGCPLDEPAYEIIGKIQNLEELYLESTPTDDDRLQRLRGLVKLKSLSLQETVVSDDGLTHLADMHELRFLYLRDCPITGRGLGRLANLPRLETIELDGTLIDDAGMAELSRCASIESVLFERTVITPKGAAYLISLPRLRTIRSDPLIARSLDVNVQAQEAIESVVKELGWDDERLAQAAPQLKVLKSTVFQVRPQGYKHDDFLAHAPTLDGIARRFEKGSADEAWAAAEAIGQSFIDLERTPWVGPLGAHKRLLQQRLYSVAVRQSAQPGSIFAAWWFNEPGVCALLEAKRVLRDRYAARADVDANAPVGRLSSRTCLQVAQIGDPAMFALDLTVIDDMIIKILEDANDIFPDPWLNLMARNPAAVDCAADISLRWVNAEPANAAAWYMRAMTLLKDDPRAALEAIQRGNSDVCPIVRLPMPAPPWPARKTVLAAFAEVNSTVTQRTRLANLITMCRGNFTGLANGLRVRNEPAAPQLDYEAWDHEILVMGRKLALSRPRQIAKIEAGLAAIDRVLAVWSRRGNEREMQCAQKRQRRNRQLQEQVQAFRTAAANRDPLYGNDPDPLEDVPEAAELLAAIDAWEVRNPKIEWRVPVTPD